MEATIETLNIKVEGEGKSAESTLDRVLKKLERIKEATRGTNGQGTASLNSHFNNLNKTLGSIKEKFNSLSQITDDLSEKTSKCRSTSVAYADAMDRVKEKAEQSQGRFKSLSENIKDAFKTSRPAAFVSVLKTIGRLTLYRMIRSMIKQVTEGFKTGIDDMYQYSKTFNGEYARSMDQLASANLSYKNSIGAIMAPLINLVNPWIDSFVDKLIEINNTIAMVFAGLAGKSTYSKAVRVTTEYAEAANKASNNTEKVTEKVEELKRSLAGLDEITIIGQNLSPVSAVMGGNDAVSNGLDYGSMFVEAPVDMAKVNEIKEKFERILEIAKWIGIAIVAWELGKFLIGIGQAIAELGRLKAGIALLITGFTIEAIGGYHIGYGDAGVMDYVKLALGSALGVVGTAMVFGFTPAGWAIGIMAALTIGIASINVGLHARLSDVIEQAFYDAGGTITISDLANQFERLMGDIININQPIVDCGSTINSTMEQQVKPAISTIEGISRGIELGAYTASDKIPEIEQAFTQLRDGTKTILDDTYDLIVRAVSGSLYDSLSDAGIYVPELLTTLARIKGEVDVTYDSIIAKQSDLQQSFNNGQISSNEYTSQLFELSEQLSSLVGATDPVKDSFAHVEEALQGVDWQNKDAKNLAFSKVSEASQNAITSVNDAYDQIEQAVGRARGWSDNSEYQLKLDKILEGASNTRQQQLDSISQYTQGMFDTVQNDLLNKMTIMSKTLGEDYKKLDPIQKFFTTKPEYISNGLADYQNNTIKPIENEFKAMFSGLGAQGNAWASAAASATLSGLFVDGGSGYVLSSNPFSNLINGIKLLTGSSYTSSVTRSSTSMADALANGYKKVGRAVPEGLAEGIKAEAFKPSNEAQDLVDSVKDVITRPTRGLAINSPSKVTTEYGKYIDLGFAEGISRNQQVVVVALDNLLNQMLSRMETFTNRWRSAINDMFDDMAFGWKNAVFRSDGSYSYNRLSMGQIQRFAQGGFPEDGFFYANHNELVGQFSNGKTAVANNEQIIEGIAGGVAVANEEQNALLREQNRLLREQNYLIQQGSTIDVSTIVSAFNRKNQRDGKVTVPVSF